MSSTSAASGGPIIPQEPDAVDGRGIIGGACAFLAFSALVVVGGAWLVAGTPRAPPAPADQVGIARRTLILDDPTEASRRADAERRLHEWAWVDRDGGIARIPVEAAREVVKSREKP